MPRSVNHVASKAKRTRILKQTKGYYGARKNVWTVAKNPVSPATSQYLSLSHLARAPPAPLLQRAAEPKR